MSAASPGAHSVGVVAKRLIRVPVSSHFSRVSSSYSLMMNCRSFPGLMLPPKWPQSKQAQKQREVRVRTGAGITVVADAASVGSDAGSIRHNGTLINTTVLTPFSVEN